jgi:DNA-binding PadR family transcriptional regulator
MESAIHSQQGFTGSGRCGGVELDDVRALWRAMTGRQEGGPGARGRHRHHHHGPGEGFGRGPGGFGFGSFSPGGPFGRSRKARRGDIRTAALLLLAEEPRNGYQIMQEVQERSNGMWSPSPGSVYPALAQLEDEGLISSQDSEGRKLFVLTDAGRELLAKRDADAPTPWDAIGRDVSGGAVALGKTMREVAFAFTQVIRTGSEAQIEKAGEVLVSVRRDLYRILADGEGASPQDAGASAPDSED